MNLRPFYLERWQQNPCKYDLGSAGMVKLRLRDLITEIDYDMELGYGATSGSSLIREEVADLFENVEKNNVLITSGTEEANFLAVYRLLKRGDDLVTVLPTFMQCINLARSLGAKVKSCRLLEREGYRLDLERFRELITKKTKIIYLANPNNPTGSIISGKEMQAICEMAEDVNAWILCDGALRGLEVDGEAASSPVENYERGIASGSLSKIGLSGIRIGWLVADEKLVKECWAYKDYTTLSHSGIGEYLATIALRKENMQKYIERAKKIIIAHRAILSNWVLENRQTLSWIPPKAGHTAFVKYNLNINSQDLCKQLLEEDGVLIEAGDYFGSPKHLRIRYSCEKEVLTEALKRFSAFLRRRQN